MVFEMGTKTKVGYKNKFYYIFIIIIVINYYYYMNFIALIHQSKYPCKSIQSGNKPSFECAIWELKIKTETFTIHGIYHPLYLLTKKITNTMFIDDFMDYVCGLWFWVISAYM